jgi:hypothetical protein
MQFDGRLETSSSLLRATAFSPRQTRNLRRQGRRLDRLGNIPLHLSDQLSKPSVNRVERRQRQRGNPPATIGVEGSDLAEERI